MHMQAVPLVSAVGDMQAVPLVSWAGVLLLAVFLMGLVGGLIVAAIKILASGSYRAVLVAGGAIGAALLVALVVFLAAAFFVAIPVTSTRYSHSDVQSHSPRVTVSKLSDNPSEEPATTVTLEEESPTVEAAEPMASDSSAPSVTTDPKRVTPSPRPRWVDSAPVLRGDVQQRAVSSGPFEKRSDCRRALDVQLKQAVDEYIDEYFDDAYGPRLKPSQVIHYDANWIKSHLLGPDGLYQETVQVSFGPMQQVHALLVFDEAFRQKLDDRRAELDRACRGLVATSRLWATALGFGFGLSLLGIVYGFLRIDSASHSRHSRQLQFLGGAAILALIAVVVGLARHIPWM